jgi:tRNA U55 pseudouridine synthase TruB
VPPSYSALKRAGRPLYDYARAGEAVEAAPRTVVVHELELTSFAGPAAAAFTMRCSKGTYVRALARDLGRALGVGAHVTALRRRRSGPFSLAEARPLDEVLALLADPGAGRAALPLVDLPAALRHLEQRVVSETVARDVRMGRRIYMGILEGFPNPPAMSSGGQSPPALDETVLEPGEDASDRRICLVDGGGRLVAVTRPRPDQTLELIRVFGA